MCRVCEENQPAHAVKGKNYPCCGPEAQAACLGRRPTTLATGAYACNPMAAGTRTASMRLQHALTY